MKSEIDKQVDKIVKGIWEDIYGRSGGDHFLDCGGEDWAEETKREMKQSWRKIIRKALESK